MTKYVLVMSGNSSVYAGCHLIALLTLETCCQVVLLHTNDVVFKD